MRLLSILGPTASGKSSVAMELARRLNGEIISCDSMQIYRELDIGTAKPTTQEQRDIPHHLIDIRDISDGFNVAQFLDEADTAVRHCMDRGVQPILCGGTGLYAKALLYGFDLRPRDPEIAKTLRQKYEHGGAEALLEELRTGCPEALEEAGENPRHWLRALEVYRITGRAPKTQNRFEAPAYVAPECILMPSADLSRQRIRERADVMLETGWIDEAKAIGAERFRASATAVQAIGYSLIFDHLDGKLSYHELVERIAIGTSQYAKRQRTWFRNQHPNAILIPVEDGDTAITLAEKVLEAF